MLAADTVVGPYRIDGLLGRGGMAAVYRATHVGVGRQVALKLLDPELGADDGFVARFQREGRMQASLRHPHALTVFDAGTSEHGVYLAMQLVAGPTLAELIQDASLGATRAL